MIVVFVKPVGSDDKAFKFVGQTEHINNNHDPNFATIVAFDVPNDGDCDVKIGAYDVDSKSANDMLGVSYMRASALRGRGGVEFALSLESGAPSNPDPSKRARVVVSDGDAVAPVLSALTEVSERSAPVQESEPQQPEQPVSEPFRLELKLGCRDLPRADTKSLSDPMIVVFVKPVGSDDKAFKFVGQTEHINNNHDPTFATIVAFDVPNDGDCDVKIGAYDVDSKSANDLLGVSYMRASALRGRGGVEFALSLESGAPSNPDPSKRARVVVSDGELIGSIPLSLRPDAVPLSASNTTLQPTAPTSPPPKTVGFFKRIFSSKKKKK
jgi:Ca2+-dependent lipid-binding protein